MVESAAWRIRCSEPDQVPGIAANVITTATPLGHGAFLLEASGLRLGDVGLLVASCSPLLLQGALPRDRVGAILPLSSDGPLLLNGRAAKRHAAAILGAGAWLDAASHGVARCIILSLESGLAGRLLERPDGLPVFRAGTHAMLACGPAAWRAAAELVQSAVEVAERDPEVFAVEEARRSLRSSLIEAAQELLGQAPAEPAPRDAPEHPRLVRAIEDHLRVHPAAAAAAADLAAALGVPVRRLQQAVRATYGIGLQRHIRLRRLMLFRSALRQAGPGGTAPKAIALAHGFWDMPRLARDYRRVFGETLPAISGAADRQPRVAATDAGIPDS